MGFSCHCEIISFSTLESTRCQCWWWCHIIEATFVINERCLHHPCPDSSLHSLVGFLSDSPALTLFTVETVLVLQESAACSACYPTMLPPRHTHTINMHTQALSSKHNVHTNGHTNTFGKITILTIITSKSITLVCSLISLTMIRFKLVTATAMVNQYPNLPTINRQPCREVNISLWETH